MVKKYKTKKKHAKSREGRECRRTKSCPRVWLEGGVKNLVEGM